MILKKLEVLWRKIKPQNKIFFYFFQNFLTIDKDEIFNQKTIAQNFNEFFVNIGTKLVKKTVNPERSFESHVYIMRQSKT